MTVTEKTDSKNTDSSIPELWAKSVLREQLQGGFFAPRFARDPNFHPPPIPWRVRRWRRLKWQVRDAREAVALKIAPWLEPDDWR